MNRVRTLARFPRAVLLGALAAYLAACSGGARGVAPGQGPQGPAPSALVPTTQPTEPNGVSSEASTASPAPQASLEGRDRQFEILNEAVSALRQEASRSYERVSDLTRETERLRVLIASLQRRLAKNRDENRELLDHVRELEERLQEVRTPPPEGAGEARPGDPQSAPRAPMISASPEQGAASGADGGSSPTEGAGDAPPPPSGP